MFYYWKVLNIRTILLITRTTGGSSLSYVVHDKQLSNYWRMKR